MMRMGGRGGGSGGTAGAAGAGGKAANDNSKKVGDKSNVVQFPRQTKAPSDTSKKTPVRIAA